MVVPSQHGQKVIVDQCESCGGIWFDAFELYKVKQEGDELTEELDADIFRAPSEIQNRNLLCPRDKTQLFQFQDPRFPKSIILMRCPKCQGFWLNRGEFSKYREARQKLTQPWNRTLTDETLNAQVERLLESQRTGNSTDVMAKVGQFLSTPVTDQSIFPPGGGRGLLEKGNTFNSILDILILILRLVIFKH